MERHYPYRFARMLPVALIGSTVAMMPARAHAAATAIQCRTTIVSATGRYVHDRTNALAKCWDGILAGKTTGPCPDEKATKVIDKAATKLDEAIGKACGGADKVCGGAGPDLNLAAIGWNVGNCSVVGNGICQGTIGDCADVADCVRCIGDRNVDQAFSLYYDAGVAVSADKSLRHCLRAIGKSSAGVLAKASSGFAICWVGVSKADSGGSFSCPDGKTVSAGLKARKTKIKQICSKCGGPTKACGGADDVPPAATGFPATCPAIGSCGGAIQTLRDVANCSDCVTNLLADVTARSSIPAFTNTSPPQCVTAPMVQP